MTFLISLLFFFFFNATATTEIYTYGPTLPLHDALPSSARATINVAMSGNRRIRPTDPSPAWLGAIANGPRVPCDDIPGSITRPWRREASLPPPQWLAGSRAACAPRTVDEKTLRRPAPVQ